MKVLGTVFQLVGAAFLLAVIWATDSPDLRAVAVGTLLIAAGAQLRGRP